MKLCLHCIHFLHTDLFDWRSISSWHAEAAAGEVSQTEARSQSLDRRRGKEQLRPAATHLSLALASHTSRVRT